MNMNRPAWLVTLALASLLAAEARAAGPVSIVVPKPGGTVGKLAEVIFESQVPGSPITIVKAEDDVEWWVQQPGSPLSRGQFRSLARFGNAVTQPGTRFEVVVMMARTPEEAAGFKPGDAFRQLPSDIPQSAPVLVTLGGAVAPASVSVPAGGPGVVPAVATGLRPIDRVVGQDVIQSPAENDKVGRVGMLRGKLAGAGRPVVLVRAEEDVEWWVQEPARAGEAGAFEARVRFGNDRTPDGTRFRVVVVAADDAVAAVLAPGSAHRELPAGIKASKEVQVVLQRK